MRYLIVPGLGGSKLICNCRQQERTIYPKPLYGVFRNLDPHFFDPACKTSVKPMLSIYKISVYRRLVNRLGSSNCQIYAYDWRRPPLDIAQELAMHIEDGTTLIGHSNGGFILRILFEYLDFDRSRVAGVIICGTPMFGSHDPFSYNQEYDIYRKLKGEAECRSIKSLMLTTRDICKIFQVYRNTLIYFTPSHCLRQLAAIDIDEIELVKARAVHYHLSRMMFRSYVIYFNIHKTSKLVKLFSPGENAEVIKYSDDYNAKTKSIRYVTKSDNLIIPSSVTSPGALLIHDTTPLAHCFIMNSRFLANEIKRNH